MNIDEDVTDFFKLNESFCFLTDKNEDSYEIPIVGYVKKPENKLNFTYIFGGFLLCILARSLKNGFQFLLFPFLKSTGGSSPASLVPAICPAPRFIVGTPSSFKQRIILITLSIFIRLNLE